MIGGVFIGAGTVINIGAVVVGSGLGLLLGNRFPERTRTLVTQCLGLFTMVLGAGAIADGLSPALAQEAGEGAPMLIVLGALLLGAITGSLIRLEDRLDTGAEWLRRKLARGAEPGRFSEGLVTATLVFCVGPLSILGSINDGLGAGAEQLVVKSVLDGFAAIAFASTLGVGVLFSVLPLALYQGSLTVLGLGLGTFLSVGQVDALGATGGLILLGLGIRLAGIKKINVADLLPGLVFAPLLVWLVSLWR
ncbi:MAG: DUF554 domain-containing protein [Bifidobacteriaceae bacterium]|jgi:uncharacterized membrane protein YqgA involved in biofilm formation|nr:DUF554 domain-containing protein [Bifidobacteriaceae bacterium]